MGRLGTPVPARSSETTEMPSAKRRSLGRSSIEAYVFFICAAVAVVMQSFGIPISFPLGAFLSLAILICAADLLWHSPWTIEWSRLGKIAALILVLIPLGSLAVKGYRLT